MEEPDPESGPTAGVIVSVGIAAEVSQAPQGDGKVSDIAEPGTEGGASAVVSAAARAASSSSERKKLSGRVSCA